MQDLLEEYKESKAKLECRLAELLTLRGILRGEEAILLGRRIDTAQQELYEINYAMDQITKYLEVKP